MDFAVPGDHREYIKESKKRDKYLNIAREPRKQWAVIPVVIGALGTVPKGLERGIEELKIRGQIETIQTIELLRSATTLRSPGDLRRLTVTQTSERPSANVVVKNLPGV